ncbi:hypothetical protein SAMN04487765_1549 [Tenacibaculum sp. MAR_2010_89]|uniref:hypothetical protein n=1 Tax=Tenacibaculum sp. MAR_2010_89 TaxID=1250198 RepID=UPI00089BC71A|nr:hypothetical protein [Tenacibaculum sp. MAR_2010_89]SEE14458.1 hypothetical protein SAMN04487765_1549 [Tenacibaculum sp. MAR_2010_89]
MSVINEPISIPKNITTKDDLDFSFLRKEGISYLESFGGKLWTDFNSHDPGVTILEMLCYAITDLGMRMNTPLEDLLASKNPDLSLQAQFYKASEILPSKPVNELDYRKLFIDIKGVKNCWLRIYDKQVHVDCKNNKLAYKKFTNILPEFQKKFKLKGLYTLLVDLEEGYSDELFSTIKTIYHQNRNLCEDLIEVKQVEEQPIAICANVDVVPEADEEKIYATILFEIENYLSPSLQVYSVQQMLDKEYTTDEIFDGPILKNGFINTEELKNADLRKEVRLSDIMKLIMNVEGVKLIKDISVGFCDESLTQENKWVVCIDKDKKPVLCDKSSFNFSKGFLPLNLNYERVNTYLEQLKEDDKEAQKIADADKDLPLPKGNVVASNEYTTIQNDFPDTYGIGQEGLSVHVTNERKSKAKQLKGYLTFFDQILATYFKHLSEVRTLLSVSGQEKRTYFTQAIKDIKDFESIANEYPESNDAELTKLLLSQFDNNIERRNSILDHLLARFAERFGEYTFIMKALYGTATDEIVLSNKEAFLKDYKVISSDRGLAFNYYKQSEEGLWGTNNVSGFQKRIARLMGISNEKRRHLTETNVEVYDLLNSHNKTVYRWRLKDNDGAILLSATESYTKVAFAIEELYFAVLQIVQTSESEIEKAFEIGIKDNTEIGFIRIHKSTPSKPSIPVKYSFDVINPEKPESSSDYIIAKQFKYHTSLNDLKEALLAVVSFMKKDFTEEGMFLVEHMLLRPDVNSNDSVNFLPICADDCADCGTIDPYSYRVSIVLPGYTYRFSNPDFRRYMEDVIRQELPAHVLPRICWVGERKGTVADDDNDLLQFEDSYKKYLFAKTNSEQKQPIEGNELQDLMNAMQKLNTIYPVGRLTDCNAEDEALDGRIILGQSSIGNIAVEKENNKEIKS